MSEKVANKFDDAPSGPVRDRLNSRLKPLGKGGMALAGGPRQIGSTDGILGGGFAPVQARPFPEHARFTWGQLEGAERRRERDRVLDGAWARVAACATCGPAQRAFLAADPARPPLLPPLCPRCEFTAAEQAAEHEDECDHEGGLLLAPPRPMLVLVGEADSCDVCGAHTTNVGPLCTRCADRAARPTTRTATPGPTGADAAPGGETGEAGPVALVQPAAPAREAA